MKAFSLLACGVAIVLGQFLSARADDKPATPDASVLKPAGDGWLPVLSDKDLSGLKAEPEYWHVKDGVLEGFTPGGKQHHYSYTEKDYANFELHADVKLVGYNSGVCIRIAPENFD
ncbi:MAG TPA: family 16 glycoside hydrolase, partial [Tepidisphaeraceae bacterium]|nr:family 16 glycoside hydrolase [Tepidisphaeraceae bacterium]